MKAIQRSSCDSAANAGSSSDNSPMPSRCEISSVIASRGQPPSFSSNAAKPEGVPDALACDCSEPRQIAGFCNTRSRAVDMRIEAQVPRPEARGPSENQRKPVKDASKQEMKMSFEYDCIPDDFATDSSTNVVSPLGPRASELGTVFSGKPSVPDQPYRQSLDRELLAPRVYIYGFELRVLG